MTFATEKNKPVSQKIGIIEIDLPVDLTTPISFEAGIYRAILWRDPDRATPTFTLFETYAVFNVDNIRYNIQSVKVGNIPHAKTTNLADLRAQNKSFFFDLDNQIIYLHMDTGDMPFIQGDIKLGAVQGFSTEVDQTSLSAYYNDVYYDPRIKSMPALAKSKDPLSFGLVRYQGGAVVLDNADGEFDNWKKEDVIGQPVRAKVGFPGLSFSDFRTVFSGYIEDFSNNWLTHTVNIQDKRKVLSRKIPIRKLSQDAYPALEEKFIDKPIPLAYGSIRNAPAFRITGAFGDTTNTFLFMDTTDHDAQGLTTVYADGLSITVQSSDLTAGTFTVNTVDCYELDDGGVKTERLRNITADFIGADSIANGLDVLKDVLDIYGDIEFLAINYNTTEWNAETTDAADVGLYLKKERKISDIIQDDSTSIHSMILVQDDGLFTARVYDSGRTPIRTIEDDEWLNDPEFQVKSEEFFTSAKVLYSRDEKENSEYLSITNTDFQETAFDKFKFYNEKEIKTLLTSSADAETKSTAFLERTSDIFPTVTRKTKIQNIDLEIMDFIIANHSRQSISENAQEWGVWEIIGITKNIHPNPEVTLVMKLVA